MGSTAWYEYTTTDITSLESIIGRAVIVHASFDHGAGYGCDQAGTSGARQLACVIGYANNTAITPPTSPITTSTSFLLWPTSLMMDTDNTFFNTDCASFPPSVSTTTPSTSGGASILIAQQLGLLIIALGTRLVLY